MAKFTPAQALIGFIFAPQVISSLTSNYPPFQVAVSRKAFSEKPNLVSPVSELIGQRQKGVLTEEQYINAMMEIGYAPKASYRMLENARTFLSALDYITAWRRNEITEETLDMELKRQGISDQDLRLLKVVTIYYPTPQDLIRFAVRDVYTPKTVAEYGLDQDYPRDLDEAAIKAGLTPQIAREYWAAHWELPSPTQVFDMFHRKQLTEEQVKEYLKSADYMPFWRDHMVKLSYDTIGRVDIRRMYSLGVLSEDDVTLRYEYLGYSPEDARLMTRFTVEDAKNTDEQTPTTVVMASYKAGTIDRATAFEQLLAVKNTEIIANTLLDNADASIKQELIDLEADAITDQYRNGKIDLAEYQTQLTRIGVPARMLQLTIQRELAQAKKRTKVSTKSDLDVWWRTGVIGYKIYRERMTALGYTESDIKSYIAELEIAELAGVDKKYPWAPAMRDFIDGEILGNGLEIELTPLVKDPDQRQKLMNIAMGQRP